MTAQYQVHGDVAIITLDNPPVNGLGLDPSGHRRWLAQANADSAVKAIIITGAGKAFSGGADIKEFGSPKAMQEPNLLSVISLLENSGKPVVGAIHTLCMGGGLELALGCHYRVAAPGTSVALPEVKLGLLPGAGGTQRLPSVLGVEPALNMIVSGEAIKSEMLAMLPGQKCLTRWQRRLSPWPRKHWSLPDRWPTHGRLPLVRNLPCKHPQGDAYFQFARNMVKGCPRISRRRPSVWMRWRPPPRRSSTTAWRLSARSSSTSCGPRDASSLRHLFTGRTCSQQDPRCPRRHAKARNRGSSGHWRRAPWVVASP
jgi:3-hydroxyacyl-CoA dehydrogenase